MIPDICFIQECEKLNAFLTINTFGLEEMKIRVWVS